MESAPDLTPLGVLLAPPFGWVFAVLFGAVWGSFWNVAIHRLAREDARLRDVVSPPSHCPRCGTRIRARDNLPILGWLLLRGRCRDCGVGIPIRYPLVEALGGLAAAAVYLVFVLDRPDALAAMYGRFFVYFFFTGTLIVLAFIDLDTMLLPEAITIPAIPAFFLLGRVIGDVSWTEALVGAAVGFGALKALEIGYRVVTGRDGLGGGDSMLMALVGGFLGWRSLPFTLGLGATLGTLVTVPILLVRRARGGGDAAQQKDVATQPDDAALQQLPASPPPDAAMQQDDAGAQQNDAASQHDGEVSLRHVEVPFGPFLVAGALLYMFLHDWWWSWLLDWGARP